jgi:malyl-CoA/(S)-citramalyl-CoA lyase
MKLPRNFFKPLAMGAPAPLRELPVKLERMIHFVPPHIEKLRAKVPELIAEVDVVLGNLEDAIPADAKQAARAGFIALAKANDFGATGLWTRVNALNSPWMLDDVVEIVGAVGERLDVVMLPKVEGPWDIHYLDQLLAQLEAKHAIKKPILIHAILETAEGVDNVADIAVASPRMHGIRNTRFSPTPPPGMDRAPRFSRTSGTTRWPRWSMPAPRRASRRFMAHSATSPTRRPAKRSSAMPS